MYLTNYILRTRTCTYLVLTTTNANTCVWSERFGSSILKAQTKVFFLQFCDVAKVDIISKWFSQICPNVLIWKQEKIKIILYFWLPTGINNKNMVIGRTCFQILANLGHFFMENPSYRSKSYFSNKLFGKNLPIKKILA
jgi:hypothetical protein